MYKFKDSQQSDHNLENITSRLSSPTVPEDQESLLEKVRGVRTGMRSKKKSGAVEACCSFRQRSVRHRRTFCLGTRLDPVENPSLQHDTGN
jgi:hypothetical protein